MVPSKATVMFEEVLDIDSGDQLQREALARTARPNPATRSRYDEPGL